MNQRLRPALVADLRPIGLLLPAGLLLPVGLLLLAVLLAAGPGSGPAAAQTPAPRAAVVDPYVLTGVPVDATAANSLDARARALAEGQRAAFRRLLQRLTPEQSWASLPPASESVVQSAVRGFQIQGERGSATRYIAKLDVAFNREVVRRLLQDAGIAFTETASRPILVVPVWRGSAGVQLWEEDNPWRQALLARPERDSLAPLLIPAPDQPGLEAVTAQSVVARDDAALRRLADQLGAGAVVVAEARPSAGGIELATTRYGAGAPESTTASFATLAAAAEGLSRSLDEAWKARTILRFDAVGSLTAEVPIQSIGDWVKIRQRLTETSEIKKLDVTALTARTAEVTLSLLGDPETLRLALRQRDLSLTQTDGGWRIERTDAARPNPSASPATTR